MAMTVLAHKLQRNDQACSQLQGGDLRHAIKGLDARAAQLQWHNKGGQVALDVVQGLHFLHSHGVSSCWPPSNLWLAQEWLSSE